MTHVVDWIGASHYPNVADWIEETIRFGVSRRISRATSFERLTRESRLILIHPRAWLDNAAEYFAAREQARRDYAAREQARRDYAANALPWCPKHLTDHVQAIPPTMCSSLWWEDIEGGVERPGKPPRSVTRTMPSFSYHAWRRPDGEA